METVGASQDNTLKIIEVLQVFLRIKKILIRFDLTPYHYHTLLLLHATPGLTPSKIGKELGTHPAKVTRITDRLANAWLIDRYFGEDRRTTCIKLTDKGREILEQINAKINSETEDRSSAPAP